MENALAFGIEKFRAVNIEDDRQIVEVYVEGEDEAVNEFCRFAKSNFPHDAVVDEVRVEDYAGYVPKLEAFALIFNVGQSRKFIEYGKQVLNKQDKMLEKIDLMLEKQDETVKVVKELGESWQCCRENRCSQARSQSLPRREAQKDRNGDRENKRGCRSEITFPARKNSGAKPSYCKPHFPDQVVIVKRRIPSTVFQSPVNLE